MHHMTIRNVDPAVKAALEETAKAQRISQSEAARRALAEGLGVRIPKRNLRGLGRRMGLTEEQLEELGKIDWTKPAFTDEEWEQMEAEEEERCRTDHPKAAE